MNPGWPIAMQTPPSPRASLARSTLLRMSARIAVIIVLSTLASYVLVSNAKYALDEVPSAERCLTVKMEAVPTGRVRIEIHDNGMGIAPEMLTRIFQYGFTTREEGHGFGLHSSALAAQEIGGSLIVHSDGPGKGATFMLEIPHQPVG
jgi:signal transduction histidine kinase